MLKNEFLNPDPTGLRGAAVTGRFCPQINLPSIPPKQALLRGYRFLFGNEPATIVNIGSHGFCVLEIRANGVTVFRENSRCSQGTGNFLRQLVERFSLTVEAASELCADVADPAPLSGRCPVILKTDMTHLANKGEDRARILAGLFDAVCENVFILIKPGVSPARVLLTGGVSRSPRVRRVFGEMLAKHGMTLVEADRRAVALPGSARLCAPRIGKSRAAAGAGKIAAAATRIETGTTARPRRITFPVRRMPKQTWAKVNGNRTPARARLRHRFHRLKSRGH